MNALSAEEKGTKVLRVLVIDDDELSRELLAMLLDVEGYQVDLADSGSSALMHLRQGTAADIILADVQMPGVTGDELALALRADSPEGTLLLAMSGSQPSPFVLKNFDGFLLKPFTVSELDAALAQTGHRPDGPTRSGQIDDVSARTGADHSPEPALNEEIYLKLGEMMSSTQLGQMYALCIADVRSRVAEMTTLAEKGDDEGYRRAAHSVKGGCGMIGATELYHLAATAEISGLGTAVSGAQTGSNAGTSVGDHDGTNGVTATLSRFSSACGRLERILVERKRD